jgi:Ice-binding-like/IPTL-CTERM motif
MNAQTTSTSQFRHAVPRVSETRSRFSRGYPGLLAILGLAANFFVSAPVLAQAYLGVNLTPYAVLAGTTVTCAGAGAITGDVGVAPGAAIVGFPAPCTDIGTLNIPPVSNAGQADLLIAFGTLAGRACDGGIVGPDLAGLTLTPGTYCVNAAASNLTGLLQLNAQGNPNATWVFEMTSTLITSVGSTVTVINGGNPCGAQWLVNSSAVINGGTTMVGNILALTDITLNGNLTGRALARNGQVTMAGGPIVSFAACGAGAGNAGAPAPFSVFGAPPLVPPTLGKAFGPATIGAGGVSTLTVTLNNLNAAIATLTAPLVDTLPGGVVIAATPNVSTTCGVGVPVAVAGSSTVTLPLGSTIPANGSCTLTVNVTSAAAGTFINTLLAGALVTSNGNNAAPAVATLLVGGGGSIPTLSEWAMIMLAALLAIAGFAAMRRRAR